MRGFVVVAIVGLVSMALANTPGRIFGLALLIALGFFAVVGAAAIVRIAAERILSEGTAMPPFAALTRGAIVCVLAVLVPIFGWFVVLPVGLCISVGGGIAAFVTPTRSRALCPIPGEGQAVDGEVR
jgi:hypothetical protein